MFSFFSDNFEQLGSFLTSHSEAEKLAALDKKKNSFIDLVPRVPSFCINKI